MTGDWEAFMDFEQMSHILRSKRQITLVATWGIDQRKGFRATDTRTVLANKEMATEIKEKGINGLRHNQEIGPTSLKEGQLQGVRKREESWMPWIPSPAQEAQRETWEKSLVLD